MPVNHKVKPRVLSLHFSVKYVVTTLSLHNHFSYILISLMLVSLCVLE